MSSTAQEFKTRGGWKAILEKAYSENILPGSFYTFKHYADIKKDQRWKDWFLNKDGSVTVWHDKGMECREHNGCLAGMNDRDFDIIGEWDA